MSAAARFIQQALVLVGNTLTVIGCLGLVLSAVGIIDAERFAIGISSGVRIIGTVAIAGCLFSAMGYGIADFELRQKNES